MPQPSAPAPPDLDPAFSALDAYDHGSPRAALLPLDDAARAAPANPALHRTLQRRLSAFLDRRPNPVASAYACRLLGQIGDAHAVPALARLLEDPERTDPARRALEMIPDPAAVRALRDRLPRLTGLARMGIIQSLGQRRDVSSTRPLARLLGGTDTATAEAAAWALGEIGTPAAARALRAALPRAATDRRPALHDAALACAERRRAAGDRAETRALAAALLEIHPPDHVRRAAQRLREASA